MAKRLTQDAQKRTKDAATLGPAAGHERILGARERYASGVWAVPLALAPGFVLAALFSVPTPLEPLTEAVMQLTPVSLANVLLGALGTFARAAALLGAIAITLPVGGLIALASPDAAARRRSSSRMLRWLVTALLALAAVLPLTLAAPYPPEALAAQVAGALFVPALLITRRWQPGAAHAPQPSRTMGGPSRRAVLRGLVASGVTVAGALALGSFDIWANALGGVLGRSETLRTLFPFTPLGPRAAGFPVAGVEAEVTPVQHFYLLSKNDVDPLIEPADWQLRVTGAVDRPLSVSYAQLLALPRTDEYVTLRCVNNPPGGHLMSNAYWSGVSVAMLLDQAGVHSNAQALVLHAPDAYAEVLPLEAARAPSALLAYGMNGETLPRRHGGPVRALVPGFFGFKNVKWVESIEVVTTRAAGYWAQRGWTASRIHSVARIDVWQPAADGLLVAGVAFAGAQGVAVVQVRVDGGAWQAAQLNAPALSEMSWVQWRIQLRLARGAHEIAARVVDGAGTPQDDVSSDEYPNGSTGLDTQRVTV